MKHLFRRVVRSALLSSARGTLPSALLLCLFVAGCAQTRYDWGKYERLLYQMYVEPGSAMPEEQIQILTRQIGETQARERRVPPGVHAHLGFLHFQTGDPTSAVEHFMAEKTLFPESATFVDGILERLEKKAEQ